MRFLNMTTKNQQTDENLGHFLNTQHARRGENSLRYNVKRDGWGVTLEPGYCSKYLQL